MFRSAQPAQGSRTAVAIDAAIRRVLEERRRAKEAGEDIYEPMSATDQVEKTENGGVEDENGSPESAEFIKPRGRIGRTVDRTRGVVRKTSNSVRSTVGPAGSYERGFIMTAGFIVLVLTVLRLTGQTSPWYAIGVSIFLMASVLAPKLRRGIDMWRGKQLQGSRMGQMMACIACAPAFTWCAGPSLKRSTKASLWTSWLGIVGGTTALLSTMV